MRQELQPEGESDDAYAAAHGGAAVRVSRVREAVQPEGQPELARSEALEYAAELQD